MKRAIWFLIVSLAFVSSTFAESSEDTYTLDQACRLVSGVHYGQIPNLNNDQRFRNNLSSSDYGIENMFRYGDFLYFVAFDTTLPQHFAKLFTLNCVNGDYSIQPIHEYEEKIQYSPAVEKVTQKYIHLADWQNISGKSYPVSVIVDKYTWKTYYIRSESLTNWSKSISDYVKTNKFFWNILSYNNGVAIVEVRLSETKKKNFRFRLQ